MRAEERHKIHRNELSEWLGEWNERIKPYSNVIFIGLLAVAVAIAAVAVWIQRSRTDKANAWARYYRAVSTDNVGELESLAIQTGAPKVAHWAALSAADTYLAKGCQGLFENKSVAGEDLRKAVEHYRTVQDESRQPTLLEQASYGLARAYEALAGTRQSQGELQKAVEAYREVVDGWPNGPYAEQAARRLEDLQRHDTKAFYDQFAQFEPQPAQPGTPGMPGGSIPFDLGSLSEDSALPGAAGGIQPDWTEEPGTATTEDDSSVPGEAAAAGSPPSETPVPPDQASPDLSPAEGAGPSEQPSAEGAAEPEMPDQPEVPEKPEVQGPSAFEEPSGEESSPPAEGPPSEPAPAAETSDPPPAAEEATDPGPSAAEEPSQASP